MLLAVTVNTPKSIKSLVASSCACKINCLDVESKFKKASLDSNKL